MTTRFKAVELAMNAAKFGIAAALLVGVAHAQIEGPPSGTNSFKDTSVLRPQPGQKVAILVFEDMECPACAASHPVELQAAAQYHVPIDRYDFPLQMHAWSRDAAVFARYLQDKVSPAVADQYRTDLFRQQISIGSKDDLQNFNRQWMQQHGQNMPFSISPEESAKVQADYKLGERLNVTRTPTIVVVTPTKYQVISGNDNGPSDPNKLFSVLEAATKNAGATPRAVRTAARK